MKENLKLPGACRAHLGIITTSVNKTWYLQTFLPKTKFKKGIEMSKYQKTRTPQPTTLWYETMYASPVVHFYKKALLKALCVVHLVVLFIIVLCASLSMLLDCQLCTTGEAYIVSYQRVVGCGVRVFVSTCALLLQWASTIKSNSACLASAERASSSSHWKINLI
jgi:hypothetical protein